MLHNVDHTFKIIYKITADCDLKVYIKENTCFTYKGVDDEIHTIRLFKDRRDRLMNFKFPNQAFKLVFDLNGKTSEFALRVTKKPGRDRRSQLKANFVEDKSIDQEVIKFDERLSVKKKIRNECPKLHDFMLPGCDFQIKVTAKSVKGNMFYEKLNKPVTFDVTKALVPINQYYKGHQIQIDLNRTKFADCNYWVRILLVDPLDLEQTDVGHIKATDIMKCEGAVAVGTSNNLDSIYPDKRPAIRIKFRSRFNIEFDLRTFDVLGNFGRKNFLGLLFILEDEDYNMFASLYFKFRINERPGRNLQANNRSKKKEQGLSADEQLEESGGDSHSS